jgi:gamma-glutamyl-gamma-aminobutyrate hydrolase PuuD
VPVRYDLSRTPELLIRTLNCLQGLVIGGGDLSIRYLRDMPPATEAYYQTVKETVKYCLANRLPLLCICQGYEVMLQAVVDIYEPVSPDYDGSAETFRQLARDRLLSD